MNNLRENKNDAAWKQLFENYDILNQVNTQGRFEISAEQIAKVREPRLMAKFDRSIDLPEIFQENRLRILPITRGRYIISHFDAYHKIEDIDTPIVRFPLPDYIQSLDFENLDSCTIVSEAMALNAAVAAGIIADFLHDDGLFSTVSGRMSSGDFKFKISNLKSNALISIDVNNSQIEIDGAYEGRKSLALFEAKCASAEDFLVRQLYYPFRTWTKHVGKEVRTVFLVYLNGVYKLYEYKFEDMENYNSLNLIKQKNYSIEAAIEITDIQKILEKIKISSAVLEPTGIPFPQANDFERVIDLCETLSKWELSRDNVAERYGFTLRQADYYTNAPLYLGLVENQDDSYNLSDRGRAILGMTYKKRQLAYCECILSHKVFSDTLQKHLDTGKMPPDAEIVQIMKNSNLSGIESDSTFLRRTSTIKRWLKWILELTTK